MLPLVSQIIPNNIVCKTKRISNIIWINETRNKKF